MGGTESSETGSLYLDLDDSMVYPGDRLTGVVHLKLDKAIQALSLSLTFAGEELRQWSENVTYIDEPGQICTILESLTDYSWVVTKKYTVITFRNKDVQAGHYTFPFMFQVPLKLPGVRQNVQGRKVVRVDYWLIARMENANATVRTGKIQVKVGRNSEVEPEI